jgi:site-specific DNA-methyltransferase (adenine-specific)
MAREEIIRSARLILGDCREVLPTIGAVSAVITDPPYGTTSNRWDVVVPFDVIWAIESPVYVLTASQPFTSKAVLSNEEWFRHEWIWIKNRGSNFANTVREPMKEHESVLVFSPGKWTYNKQMQDRTGGGAARVDYGVAFRSASENYRQFEGRDHAMLPKERVPSSWQKFNCEVGLHPTQKPLPLMEYMVATYTNPGDLVIDPFMGSGTTGLACAKLGRRFIGIETDEKYFDAARARISAFEPALF